MKSPAQLNGSYRSSSLAHSAIVFLTFLSLWLGCTQPTETPEPSPEPCGTVADCTLGDPSCRAATCENGQCVYSSAPSCTCGDGFISGAEQCDDGNTVDGDGCSSSCQISTCGDGMVSESETCDDGNGDNGDACTNQCKNAQCGDGFLQFNVEECDDGNTNDLDACSNDCKLPQCGDGEVSVNEDCDDGNMADADNCPSTCTCSDGTLCGDLCVDLATNAAHCGSCGMACEAGTKCIAGACAPGGASIYVKASNPGTTDVFGYPIALSADGNTLAVGANWEDSNATGINGNQADNSAEDSGAVYVFTRSGMTWSQQAYVKASNTDAHDYFGISVSMSADGNTLAVGAYGEANAAGAAYVFTRNGTTWSQQAYVKASNTETGDAFGASVSLSADGNTLAVGATEEESNATGINGNQADNSAFRAGAVYVFTRSGGAWSQEAYIKASNTDKFDQFGLEVSLSGDGNTLAVSAWVEDSNATGINGNQADNSAEEAGAVYVFTRSGTTWSQQAYVKGSNTEADDRFGTSVSLSGDGNTLAVGAHFEDSNGNQANNSLNASGAVYVFTRSGTTWSQQAYVKGSNTDADDQCGTSVSLSGDGNTLAVSSHSEDSNATGINGNQADNSAAQAGAVYVFTRSGTTWFQQAYVKASNTDAGDEFGASVSLSGDGNTLAVGARLEASNAMGINGDQTDNSVFASGAVYIFQ